MLTTQQLIRRRSGIGGSDAAAIAGLSKWKTKLDVYYDKVRGDDNTKESSAMRWGNVLESLILDEYSRVTGNIVTQYDNTFEHADYPHIIANIDGFVKDKKILIEAKTSNFRKDWGEEYSADIPQEYLLQVYHYMSVLNVDIAEVPVLFSGRDFVIFRVLRNKSIENNLIKLENDFWFNNIVKKIEPDSVCLNDSRNKFRVSNDESVIADQFITDKIKELHNISSKIKDLESIESSIKMDVMEYMQNNSVLSREDGKSIATWKSCSSARFNAKSFKSDNPDLYDKYIVSSTSRRFLLKK